jgi:hypothetical protein
VILFYEHRKQLTMRLAKPKVMYKFTSQKTVNITFRLKNY